MPGRRYPDTITPLIAQLRVAIEALREAGAAFEENPHRVRHEMWILQETRRNGYAASAADAIADDLDTCRKGLARLIVDAEQAQNGLRLTQRQCRGDERPHGRFNTDR